MSGMRGRPHSRRDSGSDWDRRDGPMHGLIYTGDFTWTIDMTPTP
jgi:hypothetical protein